jgi:hypothetical protein
MPDWYRKVSRKLEGSKFSVEEREEISREVGAYLEDSCGDASVQGLDDRAATDRAISELHEDKHLGANLFRARREGNMNLNDRTRQIWLPMIGLLLASITLLAAFRMGASWAYHAYAPMQPGRNLSSLVANLIRGRAVELAIYLVWLYTLPFLGAAGASWSRHAGGGLAAQVSIGFSPLALFAAFFVGQHGVAHTPLGFLAMNVLPPTYMVFPYWAGLNNLVATWIVIPGAALLLGVLPCFRNSGARAKEARRARYIVPLRES